MANDLFTNILLLYIYIQKQYIFLHDAIVEYFNNGDTSYTLDNLREAYTSITKHNPDVHGGSEIQRQFDVCYTVFQLR